MLGKLVDNRNPNSLVAGFRKKRFLLFRSLLTELKLPIRILDVGGTEVFWTVMGLATTEKIHITLLNLTEQAIFASNFASVVGDARSLEFEDSSFDVIFSNSVIEHVGEYADQQRMASEINRVGQRYFVQTPNRYFFIEPHFLFPFYQFLPIKTRTWLLQHFDLGWYKRTRDPGVARKQVEGIHLLSKKELIALFPGATISEEKVIGFPKSFIVYDGWG